MALQPGPPGLRYSDTESEYMQSLRTTLRSPEFTTGFLHIVKCTIAASFAWWLAVAILDSQIPFLAPWVALMIMMPTVYKSLKHGIECTIASWIGVALSYVIGTFLGVYLWSFALAIFLGMLVSRIPGLRTEGFNAATTAIFVLGAGYADQAPLLDSRSIEVAIGAFVGMGVNLLVMPPMFDREAARDVTELNRRVGDLLVELGNTFKSSWDSEASEQWLAKIDELSQDLSTATTQVERAQQGRKANLRRYLPRLRPDTRSTETQELDSLDYVEALNRTDEAVSHLRHMTRSLRDASLREEQWDEGFRDQWSRMVVKVGEAIADPDQDAEGILEWLDEVSSQFPGEERGSEPHTHWPIYGSLITSVRHIVTITKDVEPVQEEGERVEEEDQALT